MLYRNTAGYIDSSMVVIATGAALAAGTVYAYVQRASDSEWLWANLSWNASKPTTTDIPTMTHVSGGLWKLAHTPADADDTYFVNCIDSGATCYPDNYEVSILASISGYAKEATLIALGTVPQTSHVFTLGEKIMVAKGDTVNVPFSLGAVHDCTGKHLWFSVKEKLTDPAKLFEVECVLSNELNVVGYVPLTATQLNAVLSGVYEFQRVDTNPSTNPHTIVQGPFVVVPIVRT